ncbi:TM0996/MTH895 family glutaredoxin-like protein [Candidatus Micrarchaeota archaeon]|nr:TM0996/MTH895 family glutaredoxin-like protein [Candidatus Micrarchaeota archaeon]MBU1166590.1 TM0996/MTH895 family glutaredoxin-like protein [Candidatus Micrarchaeota archaeon]MBU1887278.1 TM0996/MTH895 family glutaredoxin-like protein [Candidatus Micrarchaeota archaeon]
MKIEVLGSGCHKCTELEKRTREAVKKAGVDATVEHIYDVSKIIEMGIMSTPALVIDGEVKVSGRIPDVNEIIGWLKE